MEVTVGYQPRNGRTQHGLGVEFSLGELGKVWINGEKVYDIQLVHPDAGVLLYTETGIYRVSQQDVERVIGSEWDVWNLGAQGAYLHEYPPDPQKLSDPLFVATLGHLLSGASRPPKTHGKFLYIVRDDIHVLYVGQTVIAVHKRLNQHIKHGASVLGQHFRANVPASYGWQIEVMELLSGDLDIAERDLIGQLRPRLNVHHNK